VENGMSDRSVRALSARALMLLTLFASAITLGAQTPDARFDAARDTIRAIMQATGVPSVSVAIARGDRILWEESFGFADVERKTRATPHTMYSLASISKPITATGLMTLVERGKVELDRPANRYLGAAKLRAFEGTADSATVRRLLTHTSGLPLHYQFFYAGGPPVHTMDTAIARYGVLVYPPGERYFYSNLGYGILDHIIARTSGIPYSDFMQREVFAPLGLTEMTVSDGAGLGARAAVRYDNEGNAIPPYTFDHLGASSVYASAHDLVRFGQWHLGVSLAGATDVLTAETRRRMQASDAPADGPGSARGLGWGITEDDHGLRRIAHSGSMPGVATILMLYPAESLAVVVLANRSGVPIGRIAAAMTSAVSPRYADARRKRAEEDRQADARRDAARAAAGASANGPADSTRPPEFVGRWSGRVLIRDDSVALTLDIPVSGPARLRLGTQPETELALRFRTPDEWVATRFEGEILGADAAGARAQGRHPVSLTLTRRGDRLTGWASVMTADSLSYGAVSYRVELGRGGG
jgi:CubicO group peptidase (beta-lactamase class C family)